MKKPLQDLRNKRNLTQEQASKILDIRKEYLSMIENGERNPSDELKGKMMKLYDCSITDIILALNSTKRLKRAKTKEVS